ncbi:metallophosphoesterase [Burkholderia gladioli]|uniref:metallophosphoesterase n=1 Tax=Burkholderia gladioli TaxID=28095 RepID=UPI001C211223|nr:metallophosphoesterase [Burkholderia gladioli]MBU9190305.1 metallophosphoesterase [Burkholderia gladioli]
MSTIRLLHLSDLHLMNGLYEDQRVVLDALFEDLKTQRNAIGPADAVLFSGDLIGKGTFSPDTTESLRQKFFSPILQSSGAPDDRVFMVPGNHDVEQSKRSRLAKLAIENLKSIDDVNGTLDDPSSVSALSTAFENFSIINKEFAKSNRLYTNGLYESYEIDIYGKKIGIAAINSAWCATGKSENADYGKLLIGGRQIEQLIRSLSNCDIKLALLHHPFSWLAEFDQSNVQRKIYDNFDGVFFGHNHHGDVSTIARPSGKIFISNAGCLYQGRGYFNSYSIIEIDINTHQWRTHVREYNEDRQSFSSSERFAPGGMQIYDMSGAKTDSAINALPTEEFLIAVAEAANSQLLSTSISEIAPRNLAQLFVVPPLHTVSERQLGANSADNPKSEALQLSQLLASDNSVIFVGSKESGKTTLLNYICTQANDLTSGNPSSLGAYVNLHTLSKQTRAGILQSIVNFSNGSYPRSHFIRLLEAGRMSLCLDNLDLFDTRLVAVIEEFITQYPLNKYYISVLETVQTSLAGRAIPALAPKQAIAYIHSFRRKETRELMQRWFQGSNSFAPEDVDNILTSLKRLNIPRTPFLISIFLWVHERNIAFDPVNHAEVLDTLIDGMLDKFHESKSRSRLDSTAKRHFLTDLAHYMYQLGRDYVTFNELEIFTASYFKNKLLSAASAPFIEELRNKGLFIEIDDTVYFKFDCLRAFFLSTRLQESSTFFEEAFTAEKLITLSQEIDYFTGKQRGREDALQRALSILDQYYSPVRLDIDLSLFDKIDAGDLPVSPELRDDLERELFPPRLTDEHRENLLDEADAKTNQIPERKPALSGSKSPGAVPDFILALQITSAILRNSELINDASLKRSAYQKIVRYWCEILLVAIFTVELKENNEASHELKRHLPMLNQDEFSFLVKIIVPNVIGSVMFEYLGTSQLDLVIKEHAEQAEFTIERLMSALLQIDLSLPGSLDTVERLTKDDETSKFPVAILLMKLMEKYLFKPMPDSEADKLRKVLGDLFLSRRSGGSTRTNILERDQLIQAVSKSRKSNLSQASKD